MAEAKLEIVIQAIDRASAAFKRVNSAMGRVSKAQEEYRRSLERVKRTSESTSDAISRLRNTLIALGAAFSAKKLIGSIIEAGEKVENWRNSLTALTGSVDEANRKLKELIVFARNTPFETPGVVDAAQRLEALGLDSTRYMRSIGDAAAAMTTTISEATTAFIAGIVGETEVLRRFGVQASIQGQQVTFTWKDRLGQLHSITVQRSNEIIAETLKMIWNSKYGGAMRTYMHSWKGMWLTMSSMFWEFKARIAGYGFFEYLEREFGKLFDEINRLQETGRLDEWAKRISDSLIKLTHTTIEAGRTIYEISHKLGLLSGTALKVTGALVGLTVGVKTLRFLFDVISGGAMKVYALARAFDALTGLSGVLSVVQSLSIEFGVLRAASVSLGAALSTVAAVGASAFVGWEIGTVISRVKVAGRAIGDWVQILYARIAIILENIRHVFVGTFLKVRLKVSEQMERLQEKVISGFLSILEAANKIKGLEKLIPDSAIENLRKKKEELRNSTQGLVSAIDKENLRHVQESARLRVLLGDLKKVREEKRKLTEEVGKSAAGAAPKPPKLPSMPEAPSTAAQTLALEMQLWSKRHELQMRELQVSFSMWKRHIELVKTQLRGQYQAGMISAEEYFSKLKEYAREEMTRRLSMLTVERNLLNQEFRMKVQAVMRDTSLSEEAKDKKLAILRAEYQEKLALIRDKEDQIKTEYKSTLEDIETQMEDAKNKIKERWRDMIPVEDVKMRLDSVLGNAANQTAELLVYGDRLVEGNQDVMDRLDAIWTGTWRRLQVEVLGSFLNYVQGQFQTGVISAFKNIAGNSKTMGDVVKRSMNVAGSGIMGLIRSVGVLMGTLKREALGVLRTAGAYILKAIAHIVEWLSKTLGPFALVAAPAAIAGVIALWQGAKKKLGFAEGGLVYGPWGRDRVPAFLTAGEYVIRKEVVERVGVPRLDFLNRYGKLPRFESGGYVGGVEEKRIYSGLTVGAINISINLYGEERVDVVDELERSLGERVPTVLKDIARKGVGVDEVLLS